MNSAQVNYTVTENELLAIVFSIEKFRTYLIGAIVIVHTDHVDPLYLMSKKDSKARLKRRQLVDQKDEVTRQKGEANLLGDEGKGSLIGQLNLYSRGATGHTTKAAGEIPARGQAIPEVGDHRLHQSLRHRSHMISLMMAEGVMPQLQDLKDQRRKRFGRIALSSWPPSPAFVCGGL
uniref:Reverse transcriptase RNase H-like domain-containing protein n=1 Tax=Nicotiana tabacum TaxID=4097 RepID=A0A1S4BYH8_TOBAC|nr:PREDICTED: uncharacterized protein LOC107813230 [Nicotiana tabacum]